MTLQIYDCHAHSTAVLDFFLATDPSFCPEQAFPLLGNSDYVISESIDFHVGSERDAVFVAQSFIIFMLIRIVVLIISEKIHARIYFIEVFLLLLCWVL